MNTTFSRRIHPFCMVAVAGLLSLTLVLGAVRTASADSIIATDGDFQLSISDAVPVGTVEDLVSAILMVEYVGPATDFSVWPNSFSGTIGVNGALHHDQLQFAPPPALPIPTPTVESFTTFGAAVSPVDSHFLMPPRVTVTAPSEPAIDGLTSLEPSNVPPFNGTTGFGGPLVADVSFFNADNPPQNAKLNIAQLVTRRGDELDFSFTVGTATIGLGALFEGVLVIPEPSSLFLASLAMFGLLGCVRRRR